MEMQNEQIEPIALNSRQAARFINISPRKLDELCASGDLKPSRIGKKRLFTRDQLTGLLRRAETEQVG